MLQGIYGRITTTHLWWRVEGGKSQNSSFHKGISHIDTLQKKRKKEEYTVGVNTIS